MKNRWLTIMLALLAAAAFAMSVQGGRWWSIGEAAVGPFGAKRCFDGDCVPAGLSWLGVGERWMRIGMAVWAAGLISSFMLVVMSAGIAAKRVPHLVAKVVLVSISTATLTGAVFFAQFPRGEFPVASADRGAWLFVIAIAIGAVASVLVLKTKRS